MAEVGITLQTSIARLQDYLDAEKKVLAGQDVTFEGRRLTRADLSSVRNGIDYWNGWIQRLSGSTQTRGRARRGVICGR